MKRWLLILITIAVLLMLWSNSSETEETGQSTKQERNKATAERMDITETVEATGITTPILETEVKSEINGRIASLLVKDGDTVEIGQKLAELDTRTMEAELEEARRRYDAQKLRLDKAQRDYDRLTKLAKDNYARESEYLDAKTELELAKLDLDIYEARLETALDKRSKAVIRAPHAGTVLNLAVNEGQVITGANSVSNGTTLMQIADITRLEVEIDLNEVDINKVNVGDKAQIEFDALPDVTFSGIISEIAPNAVNKNNARMFPVTITIEDQNTHIRPGISARISLKIAEALDVVGVSIAAVFFSDTFDNAPPERYVYKVVTPKNYQKQTVDTGISNSQFIEIKSGLEAGESISLVRPQNKPE